jgi:hypothetical protein
VFRGSSFKSFFRILQSISLVVVLKLLMFFAFSVCGSSSPTRMTELALSAAVISTGNGYSSAICPSRHSGGLPVGSETTVAINPPREPTACVRRGSTPAGEI